ncbi:hypothetical protein HFP65_28540 [Bacillus sp. CB62A.1]
MNLNNGNEYVEEDVQLTGEPIDNCKLQSPSELPHITHYPLKLGQKSLYVK